MDCLTSLYGGFLPQGLGLRRRPDEKYGVTKMPPIREEHEDEDTYVKFLGPDIAGTPLFTEFCAVRVCVRVRLRNQITFFFFL